MYVEREGPYNWVLQHYVSIVPFYFHSTVRWYQKGGFIDYLPKGYGLNKQTTPLPSPA